MGCNCEEYEASHQTGEHRPFCPEGSYRKAVEANGAQYVGHLSSSVAARAYWLLWAEAPAQPGSAWRNVGSTMIHVAIGGEVSIATL